MTDQTKPAPLSEEECGCLEHIAKIAPDQLTRRDTERALATIRALQTIASDYGQELDHYKAYHRSQQEREKLLMAEAVGLLRDAPAVTGIGGMVWLNKVEAFLSTLEPKPDTKEDEDGCTHDNGR